MVAARGADGAGRGVAVLDARPAEPLVRRGVHARPRAAPSLGATLHAVVHTENTPPLWYVLEWAITRVLGTGAVALRLLSALAGVATVPVAWAIGRELSSRRAAAIAAPRSSPSIPCSCGTPRRRAPTSCSCCLRRWRCCASCAPCARAARRGDGGVRADRVAGAAHPLLRRVPARADGVVAAVGPRPPPRGAGGGRRRSRIVGLALLPLISAQGGHGTQWIGEWRSVEPPAGDPPVLPHRATTARRSATASSCSSRCRSSPGVGFGLWRVLTPREERGALIALAIAAGGMLLPIAAGRARRGLPRAPQPRRGDGSRDRG